MAYHINTKERVNMTTIQKQEWLRRKRLREAIEFVESKAGIQMAHEDPNLFNQILREIEHPSARHYTTGERI
jgi:hypothetical protein